MLSAAHISIATWAYSQDGFLSSSSYYIESSWIDRSLQAIVDSDPSLRDDPNGHRALKDLLSDNEGGLKGWLEHSAPTHKKIPAAVKEELASLRALKDAEHAEHNLDHRTEYAKVAFFPPFLLLALGFSVAWIRQGFRKN